MPTSFASAKTDILQTRFLRSRRAGDITQKFGGCKIAVEQLSDDIQHTIVTSALLELRAALYGDYLLATFASRGVAWLDSIRQWTNEEASHGEVLCRIAGQFDLTSQPATLFVRYVAEVPYYANSGISVRGSIGKELVSRCVVEALASAYYRALADAVTEPTTQKALNFLAQDEARHFGMFNRMLIEERITDIRLTNFVILITAIKRMVALGNEHISYASWLVSNAQCATRHNAWQGAAKFSRLVQANVYAAKLYPLYRYKHLYYSAGMLLRVGNLRSAKLQTWLAVSLWCGVKLRIFAAKLILYLRFRPVHSHI